MRKAKLSLLAVALIAGMAGKSVAAERAGIGVEWSVGPVIQMGDFDLKIGQGFGVSWNLTPEVSVAIFGENAPIHGEYSYSNDTGAVAFDQGIQVDGQYTVSGIRIAHELPVLKVLDVYFELGVASISETQVNYHSSNGTTGAPADFGTRQTFDATGAVEGVGARFGLFKADAGTVSTELSVGGALRFVQLPDIYVFGTQEVNTTKPAAEKAEIEAVAGYTNIAIQVALNVGF